MSVLARAAAIAGLIVVLIGAHTVLSSDLDARDDGGMDVDDAPACVPTDPVRWGAGTGDADLPIRFQRNGFMYARVCQPVRLELTVRGVSVDGTGPLVVVALGEHRLTESRVDGQLNIDVDVPRAGWLAIAFVNHAVSTEGGRTLWIDRVAFTSPSP